MPKFRYIVVNKENRQLSGMVDAPSIEIAKQDLQGLGFSIVSIELTAPEQAKEEVGVIFEFAGIDSRNKNVSGTIKAESRYEAFKRLLSEYELDIHFVVQSDLKDKEKEEQQKAGVIDLMKVYQEEVKKMTNLFHEKKIKNIDRNFDKDKALVMRQVDFVLKKVNTALDEFGKEINPQDKQAITTYVNKILRLKNSTNLEYIKNTCRNLLEFIQTVEINVTKEAQVEAKLELYAESQGMINKIQKGQDFEEAEILEDKLIRWRTDNVLKKEKISLPVKLQDFFIIFFIKIIHEEPEVRLLRKESAKIRDQIKQYYTLYLKAPTPQYRQEVFNNIKGLKDRKKEIHIKINQLKQSLTSKMRDAGGMNIFEKILDIINGLSGWLLFFYLLLYFISGYFILKQIPFFEEKIPTVFYLLQTGSVKYILPVIFLLHCSTSLKLNLFKKNILADIVIFPLFVLSSLLIVFNF